MFLPEVGVTNTQTYGGVTGDKYVHLTYYAHLLAIKK